MPSMPRREKVKLKRRKAREAAGLPPEEPKPTEKKERSASWHKERERRMEKAKDVLDPVWRAEREKLDAELRAARLKRCEGLDERIKLYIKKAEEQEEEWNLVLPCDLNERRRREKEALRAPFEAWYDALEEKAFPSRFGWLPKWFRKLL